MPSVACESLPVLSSLVVLGEWTIVFGCRRWVGGAGEQLRLHRRELRWWDKLTMDTLKAVSFDELQPCQTDWCLSVGFTYGRFKELKPLTNILMSSRQHFSL